MTKLLLLLNLKDIILSKPPWSYALIMLNLLTASSQNTTE